MADRIDDVKEYLAYVPSVAQIKSLVVNQKVIDS